MKTSIEAVTATTTAIFEVLAAAGIEATELPDHEESYPLVLFGEKSLTPVIEKGSRSLSITIEMMVFVKESMRDVEELASKVEAAILGGDLIVPGFGGVRSSLQNAYFECVVTANPAKSIQEVYGYTASLIFKIDTQICGV